MTFVSLFAGIGGFDLGFERAGFQTIGQCEIDPHATSVLQKHWPNTPKHDDVTTLDGMHFGPADVVTFGSPCQDLSVAGKRAGLGGERSGPFLEAVRYIREMLEATHGRYPRVAVWENVPGAFSSNGGEDFAAVLASLVGGEVRRPADGWSYAGVAFGPLGSAEWRVLDSQHFGVAQRRRRVFLVHHPGGERAGQVLLEPQGVPGHPAKGRSPGAGITGALTGGAGSSSAGNVDDNRAQAGFVVPVLGLSQELDAEEELVGTLKMGSPSGGGTQAMIALPTGEAAPIAFRWKSAAGAGLSDGPSSPALEASEPQHAVAFAENSRNELRLEGGDGQVTGALSTGGGKPGQGTPTIATTYAVRRLTPVECERLQGFPDHHTRYAADGAEIADTHRYRMLGNAVTVTVAYWIGDRINAALAASEVTP